MIKTDLRKGVSFTTEHNKNTKKKEESTQEEKLATKPIIRCLGNKIRMMVIRSRKIILKIILAPEFKARTSSATVYSYYCKIEGNVS